MRRPEVRRPFAQVEGGGVVKTMLSYTGVAVCMAATCVLAIYGEGGVAIFTALASLLCIPPAERK